MVPRQVLLEDGNRNLTAKIAKLFFFFASLRLGEILSFSQFDSVSRLSHRSRKVAKTTKLFFLCVSAPWREPVLLTIRQRIQAPSSLTQSRQGLFFFVSAPWREPVLLTIRQYTLAPSSLTPSRQVLFFFAPLRLGEIPSFSQFDSVHWLLHRLRKAAKVGYPQRPGVLVRSFSCSRLTIRVIPSLISFAPKLINSPNRLSATLR